MAGEAGANFYFLQPSTLHVSRYALNIITIIGSGVSVCLYDPTVNIGGMSQYLLSKCPPGIPSSTVYGDVSISALVNKLEFVGALKNRIVAHVFGGAMISRTKAFNIGKQNILVACDMLESYRIPILERDTGGSCGRRVVFNTFTGVVECQLLDPMKAP